MTESHPCMIGILNLVRVNWVLLVDARAEILALQHLLQGHEAVEANHLLEAHFLEPFAVVDDPGPRRIEHLERLFAVCFGIGQDLLA